MALNAGEAAVSVLSPKKRPLKERSVACPLRPPIYLGTACPVAAGRHWTFGGKLLADTYEETYSAYE